MYKYQDITYWYINEMENKIEVEFSDGVKIVTSLLRYNPMTKTVPTDEDQLYHALRVVNSGG